VPFASMKNVLIFFPLSWLCEIGRAMPQAHSPSLFMIFDPSLQRIDSASLLVTMRAGKKVLVHRPPWFSLWYFSCAVSQAWHSAFESGPKNSKLLDPGKLMSAYIFVPLVVGWLGSWRSGFERQGANRAPSVARAVVSP